MLPSDGDHPDCSRTHLKRYRCGRLALVWDGKLHGLLLVAPALHPRAFAAMERVPSLGWLSVTVPGAVSALWGAVGAAALNSHLNQHRYASEGFPSPITAQAWQRAEAPTSPLLWSFSPSTSFFPGNRAPAAGEVWRSVAHANTLRAIALSGESFTRENCPATRRFAANSGGLITTADLATHQADWCSQFRLTTVALPFGKFPQHPRVSHPNRPEHFVRA